MHKLIKFIKFFNYKGYERELETGTYPRICLVDKVNICTLIKLTTKAVILCIVKFLLPFTIIACSLILTAYLTVYGWIAGVEYLAPIQDWYLNIIVELGYDENSTPTAILLIFTLLGGILFIVAGIVIAIILIAVVIGTFYTDFIKPIKKKLKAKKKVKSLKSKPQKKNIFRDMYSSIKEKTCFYVNIKDYDDDKK